MIPTEGPPRREQARNTEHQLPLVRARSKLAVKEFDDHGLMACGIATSDPDKSARRVVVALAYLRKGYLGLDNPYLSEEGGYADPWEMNAIPIVAKKGPHVVGSIRLIRKTPKLGLPIGKPDIEGNIIEIDPDFQEKAREATYEVSQLAKSLVGKHDITVAVIRGFIAYLQQEKQPYAVAVIDERVRRLLNGPGLNLGLPAIGPTKRYMGSMSTPILVDLADMIKSSKAARKEGLSEFLEKGQGVPGFEWYRGI